MTMGLPLSPAQEAVHAASFSPGYVSLEHDSPAEPRYRTQSIARSVHDDTCCCQVTEQACCSTFKKTSVVM